MRKFLQLLAASGLLLAASGAAALLPAGSATAAPAAAGTPPSQICGTSHGPTYYDHVIWIWMENTSYDNAIGTSQTPFTGEL